MFTNPIARDLWWVASSPDLMRDVPRFPQLDEVEAEARANAILLQVRKLDDLSTEAAAAEVGVEGWRVGLYFEALVAYWLRHLPGWSLLATNHPVREEKRTLGAFDFIVQSTAGEVEHWEVAVKFYLLRGDAAQWRSWIGPNQRDRLDKKLNRMRDHQLRLSRRDVGLQALESLGVSGVNRHVAMVKGCFFTEWGAPSAAPEYARCEAEGRWVEMTKLVALGEAFPSSRWVRRDKPYWLAPLRCPVFADDQGHLPDEVRRPEMWSRLEPRSDGEWHEVQRWFFVPEGWKTRR